MYHLPRKASVLRGFCVELKLDWCTILTKVCPFLYTLFYLLGILQLTLYNTFLIIWLYERS